MKAWHCFADKPGVADLLVIAATRNEARHAAQTAGLWDYDGYENVKARRAPDWDDMRDEPDVIETNGEITCWFPGFYDDEEFWG